MAIPQETIQQVRDAAKIEEVVGDYVSLRRRGANMIGLCPFHNEKTPSFNVNPARGIYKCFGCSKSGHAIGFIMEIERCTFPEAVRMLAKKYHIQIEEREQTEEEKQAQSDIESMTRVNEFALTFFQNQLWNTEEGRIAGQGYLMQTRQIREDIIRRFGLGYAPERSKLCYELKKHGFDDRFCVADPNDLQSVGTGVLCQKDGRTFDRFCGRVIFPFFSRSGKIIGFAGRIIKKNDNVGKYVNSPASKLFDKSNTLYGYYQAINAISRQNECILVEGQLDVVSMAQAGIENVVSSGGTSLTFPQIKLIHQFTTNLTIIYDGDGAGIKATLRGIDMALAQGMNVKIVFLPDRQDPDEFARTHTSDELREYIQNNKQDAILYKARLLSEEAGQDPQKRAQLVIDVLQSIALIPEIVSRETYIKDLADFLNYDIKMLRLRMQDMRRNNERNDKIEQRRMKEKEMEKEKEKTTNTSSRKELTTIDHNYRNLIQLLVQYGEQPLYTQSDGTWISVGDYIVSRVHEISDRTNDPLYDRIFDLYSQHSKEQDFKSEPFYKYHPDPEISGLAIEMLTDICQDQSEQIEPKHLPGLIEKMLNELRLTVVQQQLLKNDQDYIEARNANNEEQQRIILAFRKQLIDYRKQICMLLGNRTTT